MAGFNESRKYVSTKLNFKILFIILGLFFAFNSYAGRDNGILDLKLYQSGSPGTQVKTVVIDPGHGGKDPGCHGSFAHEKDICLAIGLKLGKLIETHFKDVTVKYTRKTDVFVKLYNRAKFANDNNADLFICIHVNAGGGGKAYGTESWVMGLHKAETNLAVAKRENSVIEYEEDQGQYEGFDPNSPEGSILFSLYQNTYLNQSLSFASKVQEEVTSHAGRHDRGVKQAGFLVLVYTAMPSVLIETGFATNAKEEKFLASEDGQTKMAESIFQAFTSYKKEIEGDRYKGMSKKYKPSSGEFVEDKNETPDYSKNDELKYRVQFMSSKSKINTNSSKFKDIKDIKYTYENGWYKYTSGNTPNFNNAKDIKSNLISLGYKDAFIVSFKGNERVASK